MMVVDTSALMAIVLNEAEAAACIEALEDADPLLISAGSLAEVLIVAERRGVRSEIDELVVDVRSAL